MVTVTLSKGSKPYENLNMIAQKSIAIFCASAADVSYIFVLLIFNTNIRILWTSGDVSSEFQSQSGQSSLVDVYVMYVP